MAWPAAHVGRGRIDRRNAASGFHRVHLQDRTKDPGNAYGHGYVDPSIPYIPSVYPDTICTHAINHASTRPVVVETRVRTTLRSLFITYRSRHVRSDGTSPASLPDGAHKTQEHQFRSAKSCRYKSHGAKVVEEGLLLSGPTNERPHPRWTMVDFLPGKWAIRMPRTYTPASV